MYTICFTVNLTDLKGQIIDSVNETIDIIFEPLGVKPNFAIDIDDDELQYSASLKKEKVGILAAWLNEDFQFTPDQLAKVSLKLYKGRKNTIFICSET